MAVISSYQEILSSQAARGFTDGYELGVEIAGRFMTANHWVLKLGSVLLLLAIACYMLAKEKIDDEYMDAMRWESLRLSVLISIGITLLLILCTSFQMPAKSLLLIQFIAYLIIFKIKKSRSFKE
jgi:hypothetical protein